MSKALGSWSGMRKYLEQEMLADSLKKHVEGNKEIETQPNDIDLLLEVDKLVKNGLKTKDACKQVATKYKVSKNDLYNNFLKTGK